MIEVSLNRKINWFGIQKLSIKKTLKDNCLKKTDIKYVATHGLSAITQDTPNNQYFAYKIKNIQKSKLSQKLKKFLINKLLRAYMKKSNRNKNKKYFKKLKKNLNLEVYDHHKSHAASAYYFSILKILLF